MNTVREFSEVSVEPAVRGFLHEPAHPTAMRWCLPMAPEQIANRNCPPPWPPLSPPPATWFCVAICRFASRVPMARPFLAWLRVTAKACAGPWKFCGRRHQGGSFSAAILTAAARPACLPPSNPRSLPASCCFPTRCILRASRRSCAPHTFPSSGRLHCSFTAGAIPSDRTRR